MDAELLQKVTSEHRPVLHIIFVGTKPDIIKQAPPCQWLGYYRLVYDLNLPEYKNWLWLKEEK